jgi:hypothetical protein
MTLERFSDVPEPDRAPLLDLLRPRLDALLPDLRVLETNFPVPGRGTQDAVALDAAGGVVLIQIGPARVEGIPPGLPDRMAWFDENRPILPRLFPGAGLDGTRAPRAVLLAPEFGPTFLEALTRLRLDRLEVRRLRLLRGETTEGFLVEEAPAATSASIREPARGPAGSADAEPPSPRVEAARVPSFHPLRPPGPEELLARAEHWFRRLSPDIETRREGGETLFRFRDRTLARMRPDRDHLAIEVPGEPVRAARDARELDRGMNPVIQRYFRLVDPMPAGRTPLCKEDILTDDELAEFLEPDRP